MKSGYDYLIVGAGLAGATFAQQMTAAGKKCLVIDKRKHIAGNCYTENVGGIDVHKYGAHIFHTSDKRIWDYVNSFVEFLPYQYKPKVNYRGKIYSFPINLMTLYQVFAIKKPRVAKEFMDTLIKQPTKNTDNLEEWAIKTIGKQLYEIFVYGYTKKQWGVEPKELPSSILKRIPVRMTFDDNYFDDTYQGIPVGGYTALIDKMLDGCDIILGVDYFAKKAEYEALAQKVFFSGKIDEFFGYKHGELSYRSLRHETEFLETEDYQGVAAVNYTDEHVPFTRIIEHKHFTPRLKTDYTVVTKEYPEQYNGSNTPYYPINTKDNNDKYSLYKKEADALSGRYIFCGRLAEYRYYDMHQVIASAIKKSENELKQL